MLQELFKPVAILLGFVAIAYVFMLLSKKPTSKNSDLNSILKNYSARKGVLTKSELALYRVIMEHFSEDHIVTTKVRLADFIQVKTYTDKGPTSKTALFSRISQKHADFLICEYKSARPLLWIELDDKSHNTKRAKQSDDFKNKLAASVELPLIRIKTGDDYNLAMENIKMSHEHLS